MNGKKKWKPLDLAYIGLFVALITICSWINIPMAVPFTLQTFAIFAAVSMLGLSRGTTAVLVYIILGTIGVPVFAGFSGGYGTVLGLTGGYIVGFIFTALIAGGIMKVFGKKIPVMVIAMLLGLAALYAFGTAWFIYAYNRDNGAISVMAALSACVFPYIIPDCCKIALAIVLDKRLARFIKN
ncbi:MAG: biotin transporter BioY [Lachnospiraceae bacterium]|nr:biotin transporter BioY [Lachnospiraceae bacterium]